MKDEKATIEQRMKNMKNFYVKVGDLIDKIPDAVPEEVRELLKKTILGDKDLEKLMDGIESHRPPRFFLIGRTGVGKSSLINALRGKYVATVSDTTSCTTGVQTYTCMDGNNVLMEICDTRGISESVSLNDNISAEEMLVKQINEFSPDAVIFMLNCTHKDDINSDVEFLKTLAKSYEKINNLRLPIVTVINKCDEMAPTRFKLSEEYPQSKLEKIQEMVSYYKGIIVNAGLKIDSIIPVSSLIDWQTSDGVEIGVEEIPNLPQADIENIEILFDGRYNIDALRDALEMCIQDVDAQMGLRMTFRLEEVAKRLANQLTKTFSTLAAGIAATSIIPISDIYILLILQSILVTLIASLSGRDVSLDTAKEFIFSMGGVAGLGYTFRLLAQQSSKLINGIFPSAGSVISGTIAYAGTSAIGKAAIAYYIEGKDLKKTKSEFDLEKAKIVD